jgi:hypothetical protein
MLDYFKFKKSLQIAHYYASTLIAPAAVNGPVPNAIFGDGYVIGFLQVLIMQATNEGYGKVADPIKMSRVFEVTMEKLVPGHGKIITRSLPALNTPEHPANRNYVTGRDEGNQYMVALLKGDDLAARATIMSFTGFVKRNYMGIPR